MSTEGVIQLKHLYARYSDSGQLELTGSALAVKRLAECLILGSARINLAIKKTVQAAPYDGFLKSINAETKGDHIILKREGDSLTIRGSAENLRILAANLQWLANEVDETKNDNHLHIEYYADHGYLSRLSEPLVVSVTTDLQQL